MSGKKNIIDKQKNNRKVMGRVMRFIKPYAPYLIISFLCAAVSVASQLLVPILCGNAIDYMIGKGRVDFNGVATIITAIGVATAVTAAAQWVLAACSNKITFSVSENEVLRDFKSSIWIEYISIIVIILFGILSIFSFAGIISIMIYDRVI